MPGLLAKLQTGLSRALQRGIIVLPLLALPVFLALLPVSGWQTAPDPHLIPNPATFADYSLFLLIGASISRHPRPWRPSREIRSTG